MYTSQILLGISKYQNYEIHTGCKFCWPKNLFFFCYKKKHFWSNFFILKTTSKIIVIFLVCKKNVGFMLHTKELKINVILYLLWLNIFGFAKISITASLIFLRCKEIPNGGLWCVKTIHPVYWHHHGDSFYLRLIRSLFLAI